MLADAADRALQQGLQFLVRRPVRHLADDRLHLLVGRAQVTQHLPDVLINISLQKNRIRRELESSPIHETGVFSTWNDAHLYLGMDRAVPYTHTPRPIRLRSAITPAATP